jgi:antitoxin component of MazEF toxin-antitoxin module
MTERITKGHRMTTITARRVGNSTGFTIPADTCARLGIEPGRAFTLIEGEDGLKIARTNPLLERQLTQADEVLKSEADVLQALARI